MSDEPDTNPKGLSRLYVIIGRLLDDKDEPPGGFEPRHYGFPLWLTEPIHPRARIRAFAEREDAISYGFAFNIEGLQCPVFDWTGSEWTYNEDETGRVADEFI
jgi:hypothetical protein